MSVVHEAITTGIGLVIGLATGLYFEHRATRAARRESEELRSQLSALSSNVASVGASSHTRPAPTIESRHHAPVITWLRATQDAAGRVRRVQTYSHFMGLGRSRHDIDAELGRLEAEGTIRVVDDLIELT